MIITVTPNPAWDVSYRIVRLRYGQSHQVSDVTAQAGGKGVNVASVLAHLGRDVVVVAPCGGPMGELFAADLRARGLPADLVPGADVRTSVAVLDHSEATLFNEVGVEQPLPVWGRLLNLVHALAPGADAMIVSGSLPAGAPEDLLRQLVRTAQNRGLPVVLDCRGRALTKALQEGPTLVKPNAAEAAQTTGERDPVASARHLVAAGARTAVVSNGAEGLVLAGPDGLTLRAYCTARLEGNPTGAGDALAAALTSFLAGAHRAGSVPDAAGWTQALRDGAAWAGAAVLAPVAGVVDVADIDRLRQTVIVEELPCRS